MYDWKCYEYISLPVQVERTEINLPKKLIGIALGVQLIRSLEFLVQGYRLFGVTNWQPPILISLPFFQVCRLFLTTRGEFWHTTIQTTYHTLMGINRGLLKRNKGWKTSCTVKSDNHARLGCFHAALPGARSGEFCGTCGLISAKHTHAGQKKCRPNFEMWWK